MKRYVIHTENKNEKWVENLLSVGFDGFTIVKGVGFWEGKKEKALEIIIYTDNALLIRGMADAIKRHNKQDAVLIAETDCKVVLI